MLNRANAAGRIIEYMARSDRDYRRPIPRDVWDALTPTAKRLLRFARVASDERTEHVRERTMRGSVKLLAATIRGLSAAIGGPDDR